MMGSSLFPAVLSALLLHVGGLAALSWGLHAWRGSGARLEPPATMLVAVTPIPEPEPAPVPPPPVPAAPEPVPAPAPATVETPVPPVPQVLVPKPLVQPPPPKRVETRLKPPPAVPTPQVQPPKPVPVRERPPRVVQASPMVRRAGTPGPPPGASAEPLGSAGSRTPAPPGPPPEPGHTPTPAPGPDVGRLVADGGVPMAPGTGGSGRGGTGTGAADGEGEGDGAGRGSARAGTGLGGGGGTGAGKGGSSTGSGGGGSGGSTSARPLGGYQVKPRYPESARRRGLEGTAVLRMRITEQGQVEAVQVERSAGHPDLDDSAMEAVRRWRFDPAKRDGAPIAVWVLIPVEFKLQ